MRLLVTGAAGMLGSDLVEIARAGGHEVVAATHADLDIADASAVDRIVDAERPEAIVNCAAFTDVDRSETEPELAHAVNVEGPANLARAAERAGAAILHVSTDYVFDGTKGSPYVESDEVAPLGAYARSKLDGERAVAKTALRHFIARTAWVFGASRRTFVSAALEEGGEVRAMTDQTGSPTWTGHLAPALLELVASEAYGVHHVAGSGFCTRFELAQEAIRQAGAGATIVPTTMADFGAPAPRPAFTALVSERVDGVRLPPWQEGVAGFLAQRVAAR